MAKKYSKTITSMVKDVKRRLDHNPINGHHTAVLASEAGISRNLLQEAFKAKYGTSIGQYKLQLRMSAAKKQLKNGKSIKEISIVLQYSSPSSFSNAFRSFFEASPTEWLEAGR
jgi:AraC-like DNA-binding protein